MTYQFRLLYFLYLHGFCTFLINLMLILGLNLGLPTPLYLVYGLFIYAILLHIIYILNKNYFFYLIIKCFYLNFYLIIYL